MSDAALGSNPKQLSLADLAKSLAGPDQRYNYFHGKVHHLIKLPRFCKQRVYSLTQRQPVSQCKLSFAISRRSSSTKPIT